MDFQVEVTTPAIADLADIVSYVAADNPTAAEKLGNALLNAALGLMDAPFKGSRYPRLAGVRKLTLKPYKIFYRVDEKTKVVEILRFWHSARNEPDLR